MLYNPVGAPGRFRGFVQSENNAKLTPNYQLHLATNTIESTLTHAEYIRRIVHLFQTGVLSGVKICPFRHRRNVVLVWCKKFLGWSSVAVLPH